MEDCKGAEGHKHAAASSTENHEKSRIEIPIKFYSYCPGRYPIFCEVKVKVKMKALQSPNSEHSDSVDGLFEGNNKLPADCGARTVAMSPVIYRYGGLVPKKKPLISKDHERAFFDSADWVLCKQSAGSYQKSAGPVENLQPKLQKTPHQQLPPRRPACTSGRDGIAS